MTPEMLAVRQRGYEPARRQQVVLRYTETHGLITRREVSERCQPTRPRTDSLLDHAAADELVGREGAGNEQRGVPETGEMNARKRTETHGKARTWRSPRA